MALKSRLLTTAVALPLLTGLALGPASGFDVTGDGDDDEVTAPVSLISNPADAQSIIINGTQGAEGAALILDDDRAVKIDGIITIRDRESDEDDADTYTLNQAVGIKIDTAFTGSNLSLESGLQINISELLGPQDNDSDDDGIIEGSAAIGTAQRIGLWVDAAISGNLIGKGGFIRIDGNGARGVQIDNSLTGDLDLSTALNNGQLGGILGDNTIGVEINANIGGYYRQRGAIDVRGQNSVGIEIDSSVTLTGGFMIDENINATGYSLIVAGTDGGPSHGRDESDLEADEVTANNNERRRGGAAIDSAGTLTGGLIIGGKVNRVLTQAERDALEDITDASTDDDGDRVDISPDGSNRRTTPVHFDGSRPGSGVRLTTDGEADDTATLKITGDVGDATNGGAVETLLDLTHDDEQGDEDTDIYTRGADGLKKFYYSHGLMNRATIAADGLYDGFKADAVLLDGNATIHGGLYSSGRISANANNADATAIEFADVELTDGLRNDGSVFRNEGSVEAKVSTHQGADSGKTKSSDTATAILLTGDTTFNVEAGQTPVFINRGSIDAEAEFFDSDGIKDDDGGKNEVAVNAMNVAANFNLTQELPKNDRLLDGSDDASTNSANNPYIGGGDTDIDYTGAEDSDGNDIGDGVVDDRDVPLPRMTGDVMFGIGNNVFAVKAGTVSGDISFGGGTDELNLSNEIAADDDRVVPLTEVTGRITKSSGTLDVTIGDRSVLHLQGQEGDLASDDDNYVAGDDTEGLAIENLTINGGGSLKFTVDPEKLDDELLHVTTAFTLGDDAKLTPSLTSLIDADKTVKLIRYRDGELADDISISDYLADETPFIFDVSLSIEDAVDEGDTEGEENDDDVISADFSIKSAADLGLNQTEGAALNAVLAHFIQNDNLENAITGITDQDDFRDAYSQLFPHYADGTARQLAALSEAATGAVSQHLQLAAAGGRRGADGWLQQFGDYRKQDAAADNGTVSGTSYGIAFGYDFPAGPFDALGVFSQMHFTSVNEKTTALNEVNSDGFSFGAYLADRLGPLRAEFNAAYGLHDLESTRFVNFNGTVGTGSNNLVQANWEATSTAASARLIYPIFEEQNLLRLELGADFFRLEHDDYSERQPLLEQGFAMRIKGGESEKTSQFIGLRGGYRTGGGDPVSIVWEPNYYLGWRAAGDETPYRATANFVGTSDSFTLQNFAEAEDAVELGLGVAAHNDYFAFEFNYRGQFADGVETHGGGVAIRLLF